MVLRQRTYTKATISTKRGSTMKTKNIFFKKIASSSYGEASASYGGIAVRTLWFWIVCFAGLATYLWAPITIATGPLLLAGAITAIACSILSYLLPMASPLFGSIYSFALGFLLAFICGTYASRYVGIVSMAAGITVLVFVVTLLLYQAKIIEVNNRLRGIVWTLLISSIVGSGIVFISSFFTTNLTSIFWGHGVIAIIVSIASLLIATISLVYEFDFAANLVERGVQKKYEWTAAYGLFMSISIIFIRVLELLAKTSAAKERA